MWTPRTVKKSECLNRREADVHDRIYCDDTERAGAYSENPRICKLGIAMMELVYCFDFKSTGTTFDLMDIQDEGALHMRSGSDTFRQASIHKENRDL